MKASTADRLILTVDAEESRYRSKDKREIGFTDSPPFLFNIVQNKSYQQNKRCPTKLRASASVVDFQKSITP